ncbi:hypothetical protein E4P41_10235 [Geodermatophilus sp. DF01-2]|uniref:hypothetical protein n=1 Tax=Geodermatophilus sp. DF01-2 TaxID=2559610 RepID=UPI00107481A0|nr:hypothetical protein [Geodermatophilus sp. DF01_2]TFV60884.1 hypothetical protein E4P41_10235 [Geodermatophilus sp. DF01_2]
MLVQIVSFALGIAASFVAWFIVWRTLSPKVEFSPCISRIRAQDEEDEEQYGGPCRWRVKVRNSRRRRPAMELQFTARLRFTSRLSGNTGAVQMRVTPASLPFMSKNILLVLDVAEDAFGDRALRYLRRQGVEPGDLDDLVSALDGGHVRVSCIATDSFSGSRRAFIHEYGPNDVKEGRFVFDDLSGPLTTMWRRVRGGTHPTLEIEKATSAATEAEPEQAQAP